MIRRIKEKLGDFAWIIWVPPAIALIWILGRVHTRLARLLIIITGVCLFTYFIKRDDPGSPQNPAALLFDNAEGIAITSAGIVYIF